MKHSHGRSAFFKKNFLELWAHFDDTSSLLYLSSNLNSELFLVLRVKQLSSPFTTLHASVLNDMFSQVQCEVLWDHRGLSAQKAKCIHAQWLFSSVLPTSASHTTYPATFGTSFSLLGFSHLGHWHKINEDTKKTQDSALEGVGGWGVKLLGCKIALAAALLFQHFMVSCSARLYSTVLCLLLYTSFHLCFCPRYTYA